MPRLLDLISFGTQEVGGQDDNEDNHCDQDGGGDDDNHDYPEKKLISIKITYCPHLEAPPPVDQPDAVSQRRPHKGSNGTFYQIYQDTYRVSQKNALSESSSCKLTRQRDPPGLLGACKPGLWAWMILKVRFFLGHPVHSEGSLMDREY